VRREGTVVVGFAIIATGVVLATVSLISGRDDAAAVGSIACSRDGVMVQTPVVMARADGFHLQVVNSGADRRYEIRSVGTQGTPATAGVLPEDGVVDLLLALAPGELEFACLRARSGERMIAHLELRDPARLWTPEALTCADPASGVFETGYREETFEATARRALPGLLEGDRLVKPGYPETRWHGELHVVVRDDRTVGRVVRVLNQGTWNLTVDACAGTGLTQGAVAETGAT
jgi:hypothetical protein